MFKELLFTLVSVILFSVAQHAGAEVKVNNHPFELGTAPVLSSASDGVYLGYYSISDDNTFYIKDILGNKAEETAVNAQDMKGALIDLSYLKGSIALTWRPKAGDGKKYIYVQRSEDKGRSFRKPAVLNSTTDALPPVVTATDNKDRLYVAWLDEREQKHRFFMNYSLDGGRTFQKEDILLTPDFKGAYRAGLTLKDERLDFLFFGIKEGESKPGIYHSYSEDGGKTWSSITAIETGMNWSPFTLVPVRAGNGMAVFWAGTDGLYSAYSQDGKSWTKQPFKESEGKDVYRLSVVNRGSNVFLSTSWVTRMSADEKPNVYFYRSEDAGRTWSGLRKLNSNEFNSTTSSFPDLAVSEDGKTVLVAWQDHRNIRGGIFMNYSEDGGLTWLEQDLAVEETPGKFNSYFPYIVEHKGRFYILWVRFVDDKKNAADLYLKEVDVK